jgi:protein-tyrosine phosphatase
MPFTLVFVCTANRGRSPVADAIASSLAPPEVSVRSVGIRAIPGLEPLPEAIAAAEKVGVDIRAHRSAALAPSSLADADLVVGFEPIHVASAVVDGGAERNKTFTLPELATLLPREGTGMASAAAAVARAAQRRGTAPRSIADPVGRAQPVVDQIVGEIDALTRRLVRVLFG